MQFWGNLALGLGIVLFFNCVTWKGLQAASVHQNSSAIYGQYFEGLYSTEDLENLAVDRYDHSQYFIKTRKSDDGVENLQVSTSTAPPPPFSTTTQEESTTKDPTTVSTTASSESVDSADDSALNIPGAAGIDYPIYNEVPPTGFDCQKQRYKGFFADLQTNCQAWHYCDFSDGQSTFLCPNGTLFSQVLLTCDWWFNVNCQEAKQLYVLNERLYRYVEVPKPTFPEDYHGPEVDLWLKRQLQLGLLPKTQKNLKTRVESEDENKKPINED